MWLVNWFIDWSNGWPSDRLMHWVTNPLIVWLIDWSIDWLIDWPIDRFIDQLIDWLIDWQIHRLIDWINWLIRRAIVCISWLIDWLLNFASFRACVLINRLFALSCLQISQPAGFASLMPSQSGQIDANGNTHDFGTFSSHSSSSSSNRDNNYSWSSAHGSRTASITFFRRINMVFFQLWYSFPIVRQLCEKCTYQPYLSTLFLRTDFITRVLCSEAGSLSWIVPVFFSALFVHIFKNYLEKFLLWHISLDPVETFPCNFSIFFRLLGDSSSSAKLCFLSFYYVIAAWAKVSYQLSRPIFAN